MNEVIVVSGPLGVGKSSVVKVLARKRGAVMVDGDALFLPLTELDRIEWQEMLAISWRNILSVVSNYLENGLDVVIDFVLEDGYDWVMDELGGMNVRLRYVVLTAVEEEICRRLKERDGDLQYKDRSIRILKKLLEDKRSEKYLLDTSSLKIEEVAAEIIEDERFVFGS
jgi:cytidylate kinase